MSDSGSRTGAAGHAQVRPGEVIVTHPRLLNCLNVGYQATCLPIGLWRAALESAITPLRNLSRLAAEVS